MFAKLDRLCKWVLGTYVPQEFVEPKGPGDAIARRKSLRDSLLRKTLSEDIDTFVQMANRDIHPLDVVLKSEQILNIITRMRTDAALLTRQTQHSDATANLENAQNNGVSTHQQQDIPAEGAANAHDNGRSNIT